MLKYRFEVTYQTKNLKDVSDFMQKLDLHTGDICHKEEFTFKYSKEEKPIEYFKDLFRQAFDSIECTIIHIEGGKIE